MDDESPAPNISEESLENKCQTLLSTYKKAYDLYEENNYEVMKLMRFLLWQLLHLTEKHESSPELQEQYEPIRQSLIKKVKNLYLECSLKFIHTPSKNKVLIFNSLTTPEFKEFAFFEKLLWQSGDPLFNYVYFSEQKLKNSLDNIWFLSKKWKKKTIFLYGPPKSGKSFLVKGICELKGAMLLEISNVDIISKYPNFFKLLYYLCAVIHPLVIYFKNIENIMKIMSNAISFCKMLEDSFFDSEKIPLVFFSSAKYVPSNLNPKIKERIYCFKEIAYPTNKVDLINFFALKRMMYIDISPKQKDIINTKYTNFSNKIFEVIIEKLDGQKNVGLSSKNVEIYTCKELMNLLNTANK